MIDLNNENIKNYFNSLIDVEISNINISLEKQKELNLQIFKCLHDFSSNVSPNMDTDMLTNYSSDLISISKLLNKISFNLSSFMELSSELKNVKQSISVTDGKTIDDIIKYNTTFEDYIKQISANVTKIEKFIIESNAIYHPNISMEEINQTIDNINGKMVNQATVNVKQVDDIPIEIPTNLEQNTLIISEIDKKVILPYTLDDLIEIFKTSSNRYKSLEEIIDELYTKPIEYYKNPSTARFVEAYNLVRKKQSGSIGEALSLGIELFSNYNLHPAIITACKNLDELDIYLSCLECNELDDFNFFKIIFNVTPATSNLFAKKVLQRGRQLQKGKHRFN